MDKTIILKGLAIKNFKGIKDMEINFSKTTNIYGENGIGKTTIFDAFNFLLFDKDSEDRTKFDVQPLSQSGLPVHHLETEIQGILSVNEKEVTLRKVYKEKWTKTRGKAETEFRGYVTSYYIDDVPQKQKEYKDYINNLVDENTFKLVTNPMFFAGLAWKKRREILLEIIGDIDTERVINYNSKLEPLRELLGGGVDNLLKATKEKIRRLKKDREQIPYRIDELNNSIEEHDYTELSSRRKQLEKEVKVLDKQITGESVAGEYLLAKKEELFNLKSKLQEDIQQAKMKALEPKNRLRNEVSDIENKIENIKRKINFTISKIEEINFKIERCSDKLGMLRQEYKQIRSRKLEINESEFICPTCKRELEKENIEEQKQTLEENFNQKKVNDLKKNKDAGLMLVSEIKDSKEKIEKLENDIINLEAKNKDLEDGLKFKNTELAEYSTEVTVQGQKETVEEIEVLQAQIDNFGTEDTTAMKTEKSKLQGELREIDKQLATKEINQKTKERIVELEEQEKELSSNIATLEGKEILAEEFIRTKVELLESTVNKKFKYVTFKLFNDLINGGLEECCEPMVGGVPFASNLNTAAKINAGIDIINTLSSYYNIHAPIFVDNRESVNKLIETNSQVISLIVSKDKKMKVEVI